ncbi:Oidioi.mRNA.OKI2018_I69.chr1.g454.t1.cds [Oikopleura dioica]|uniref:Oidioi.mRNA.OKI2018_I69.chr1.g454.t1.cds n=1 Tax=Oikopleura dioica TaxID=34765 RepID=A0ABN7SPA5_OIKDI|nr:Oidioi.mRNA.OKI2018_I69.chr1.g454.t1.cds [Oikopleura dioica]
MREFYILLLFVVAGSFYILFFGENFYSSSQELTVKKELLPKRNIYYLKTHKTGSTTMLNMIFRLAIKEELKIGFPKLKLKGRTNYICKHVPFKPSCIDEVQYNVIANHHVWSPEIDRVLPNATKITILREPISQFVSAFEYFGKSVFGFDGKSPTAAALEKYIERTSPSLSEINNQSTKNKKARIAENTQNPMAFDLGLSYMYKTKTEDDLGEWLVDYYDLVMITEYFDESLILLKELMKLEFTDIVYLKSNSNKKKKFSEDNLSKETKARLYYRERVDDALYKHANRTLWKKIEKFGHEKMKQEVKQLQIHCDNIVDDHFMRLGEWEAMAYMRKLQEDY